MTALGSFPFGRARIEVQYSTSPDATLTALWLRRIDDGPEVTVAVQRESGLAFTHNVPESDRPEIAAAFEAFMVRSRHRS